MVSELELRVVYACGNQQYKRLRGLSMLDIEEGRVGFCCPDCRAPWKHVLPLAPADFAPSKRQQSIPVRPE